MTGERHSINALAFVPSAWAAPSLAMRAGVDIRASCFVWCLICRRHRIRLAVFAASSEINRQQKDHCDEKALLLRPLPLRLSLFADAIVLEPAVLVHASRVKTIANAVVPGSR